MANERGVYRKKTLYSDYSCQVCKKIKKGFNLKKIVLTGGGTAGHVTPNIALIPDLKKSDYMIFYIGSNGIERTLIERENIPFYNICTGKLRRYFDMKNITDIFRILLGFFQSILHLNNIKPDILFSKGGFVSVPVVWAAGLMRIPVVIHESDITPGLANKLSIPFAKKICYSFPETANHLPEGKCIQTGVPIRRQLLSGSKEKGKELCGFNDQKPVLLIIGGSQGSQLINSAIRESLDILLGEFNICHICGKGNTTTKKNNYMQFEYVNNELADLFSLADCVISRAGATTLFELLTLKKPALLIPLSAGSRGDQICNASSFEKQGFSKILTEDKLTFQTLIDNIHLVMVERENMKMAMNSFGIPDASESVISILKSLSIGK